MAAVVRLSAPVLAIGALVVVAAITRAVVLVLEGAAEVVLAIVLDEVELVAGGSVAGGSVAGGRVAGGSVDDVLLVDDVEDVDVVEPSGMLLVVEDDVLLVDELLDVELEVELDVVVAGPAPTRNRRLA